MYSKTLTLASGLLSAAALVAAQGSASVVNQCGFPVYLWVADSPTAPEMITIQPGSSYSEGYKTNADGGGVSMKVAKVPNDGVTTDITQFEYTMDGMLWYDLSVINGNPFLAEGQSLHSNNPGCQSVRCKPGGECNSAYYQPDDNSATHACDLSSNTVLTICTAGGGHHHKGNADYVSNVEVEHKHHHKMHHKHKHHKGHHNEPEPVPAPAPVPVPAPANVVTTMVTQVVTVTQVKRDADPTPVVDNHLGARHAHNYHLHHRHGLSH